MTATYTFDVFSRLDGFGADGGNWTGYWASRAPSSSTTASPCTARGGGSSSEPTRIGVRTDAGLEHRGVRGS